MDELVKRLRCCSYSDPNGCEECRNCPNADNFYECKQKLTLQAADAIEELLKAAKAMHTWIFLHTGDEQAAYDECGLTDEMNAALGYGGQFVAKLTEEET